MNILLGTMIVISGISLIIAILTAKPSTDALSGLIQGSKTENYFSKNKSKTKDKILEKYICVNAFVFMLFIFLSNIV